MVDGPPPMRTSAPAAAWRACASAWAGLASRKSNVVPPFIWTEGRGWWVRTKTGVRNELAPAHDLGADARFPGAGERVVDAGAAAGLALHGAEGTGREEPLVQPGSRMPERGVQALPLAGAESIQRHREVVHPDLRHDDLLTSCFTATGTGCRGPPPARTIHWPKVIASAWPLSIIPAGHQAFLLTVRNRPRTQIRRASPPIWRASSVV